jgi:trimeric autotransporter adhesin
MKTETEKMNMKSKNLILIAVLITCLALVRNTQAVSPPPDGGYPGFNTAEGQNALFSLSTGSANTAVGWFSLFSDTAGSFNTATGAGALLFNTADNNTAIGAAALLFSADGLDNTAVGTAALLNNTASGNTAVGSGALRNNTAGGTLGNIQGFDVGPNVAVGWQALESNTVASANTAIGYQTLQSFTAGPMGAEQLGLCTAVGFQALANTISGFANSALGYQALINNTEGSSNTATGALALFNNTTGGDNTANGAGALIENTTGDDNTAIGGSALDSNTTGNQNTAIGVNALTNNTSGSANTAAGPFAGTNITSGAGNTVLGVAAGSGITTANNVICIGTGGQNEDNSCYIGNIFGATSPGTAVLVDVNGKLGTTTSSRRFKEDIKPMDKASEALLALNPVTFHYTTDRANAPQFGLIAEEVAEVNPDLVVRDKNGHIHTVRYEAVNAMLLNEFLKEHRKVEEQQLRITDLEANAAKHKATISDLSKDLRVLTAQLKEQAAQIQEVSARFEMNQPVTRVALNNP